MLKKHTFSAIVLSLCLLLIGSGTALWWFFQPVDASHTQTSRFVIRKGQSVSSIAAALGEAHLVRSPLIFRFIARWYHLEQNVQAGSFLLSPAMSPYQIATILTTGTDDLWVTLPEGWRKEEIAQAFARQELSAFSQTEFLELAAASEGKLFPDTYLVARDSTAQTLYSLLTNTFERKVVQGLAPELSRSDHSLDEILIMASLLEREAVGYEQMRHVAGILWNRIDLGMALQVDATLQYQRGYDEAQQTWWAPPRAADKTTASPFNTYLHPGLPSRPIANPGLDAIKAAANPLSVNDLYYVHDRSGQLHYAKTLEEHNQNVERYLR